MVNTVGDNVGWGQFMEDTWVKKRTPHPAFGHPLPEGEGIMKISLSLWERVGVREGQDNHQQKM
jgi:hypothetical protein